MTTQHNTQIKSHRKKQARAFDFVRSYSPTHKEYLKIIIINGHIIQWTTMDELFKLVGFSVI